MSYPIRTFRALRQFTSKFSTKAAMNTIKLNSGHNLPLLGLGTWQVKPEEIKNAVKTALKIGYRLIDTAPNYNNEKAIGEAIKEWLKEGGKREELFVTTKLPTYGNRPNDVCKYLNKSLKNLQLEYVDLYLVHMPFSLCPDEKGNGPAKQGDGVILEHSDHFAVWKEMEAQVYRGAVKSIGVSNFNVIQLERLFGGATIHPAVIQVEMHVYLQQHDLKHLAEKLNVKIIASSPLGSPGAKKHFADKYGMNLDILDLHKDPVVVEIAKCKGRTPAQILLIYLVQQCIPVIPKSIKPERLKENADIFNCRLNEEEMLRLYRLDKGARGRIVNFLFFKGIEEHPEYPFRRELKIIKSEVIKKQA